MLKWILREMLSIHLCIIFFQLNTLVEKVSIVPESEKLRFPKWRLKTYNWISKSHEETDFDGVIVCNGYDFLKF